MRIVERPHCRPMRCAALPHVGQMTRTEWIDTGSELDGYDNHVYLSGVAVREAGALIGMVAGGEVRARDRRITDLEAQLEQAQRDLTAAMERLAAVGTLTAVGFRVNADLAPDPPPAAADPAEQARQEQINAKRREALARGRATAAANRAAKKEAVT